MWKSREEIRQRRCFGEKQTKYTVPLSTFCHYHTTVGAFWVSVYCPRTFLYYCQGFTLQYKAPLSNCVRNRTEFTENQWSIKPPTFCLVLCWWWAVVALDKCLIRTTQQYEVKQKAVNSCSCRHLDTQPRPHQVGCFDKFNQTDIDKNIT